MADAFEGLRTPVTPIDPNPDFAARLRARVERALGLAGGDVSMTTVAVRAKPSQQATIGALTPYLAVAHAREALDWYVEVLGARLRGEPIVMPDGRIGHAELEVSGVVLMLADEFPEINVVAPRPGEGSSVSLRLEVPDLDATTESAVRAGAVLDRPPTDSPYGRGATIRDPFGHRWLLAEQAPQRFPNGTQQGDVGYISFEVPDLDRAMAFYGDVFGWTFSPGSAEQGRQVENVAPMIGLWGGVERGQPVLTWRVDDIAAAVERVRAAGGRADEPQVTPYGSTANCVDDQGTRFYLWQPTPEQAASDRQTHARPQHGSRHGDVSFLTLEFPDSARARGFYGAVLGWRFSSRPNDDGSRVEDSMPMTRLIGGHAESSAVPMYRVDDIRTTVQRVRAAGGTATEPTQEPYGLAAACTDNQGTRFSLGQL